MSLYSMLVAARSSRKPTRPQHHWTTTLTPQPENFHAGIAGVLKQQLANGEFQPSSRRCPRSGDAMVMVSVDGVELDYCQDCHGLWFDTDELHHFTGFFADIPAEDFSDRGTSWACPVCQSLLREKQWHAHSNLLVHACRQNHGVFLEDGEFERAMRLSEHVEGLAGYLNAQHLSIWRSLQNCLANGEYVPMGLPCVGCGSQSVLVTLGGVEVDYCLECQSCWFDATELQAITGQYRDVPGYRLASRRASHVCPTCQLQLRQYQFRNGKNVFVEACPAGHGVLLQQNELPLVMKASE